MCSVKGRAGGEGQEVQEARGGKRPRHGVSPQGDGIHGGGVGAVQERKAPL